MKKIIIIIFSLVFLSNNVLANDKYLNELNKWLLDNGHTQYVNIEQKAGCKKLIQKHGLKVPKVGLFDEPKVKTNEWFWLECHKPQITNNLKIKFFKKKDGTIRDSIPWNAKKISDDTLLYYGFVRSKKADLMGGKWLTEPSSNPYEFEFDLREDKKVDKELKKSAMMSYLLFENGKITVDKKSPEDRFGILLHEDAKLFSSSVGKTIVSYVLGNAVCEGYIDGVNSKIDDWPLIKNTLYDGQKIIDVINMSAGDQEYINIKDRVKKIFFILFSLIIIFWGH